MDGARVRQELARVRGGLRDRRAANDPGGTSPPGSWGAFGSATERCSVGSPVRLVGWREVVVERPVRDEIADRAARLVGRAEVNAGPDAGIDRVLLDHGGILVV